MTYTPAGAASFGQIVKQPVCGDVELLVGLVRAGLDLRLDLRDLVHADVVALERLEQVAHAGQLELVGAARGRLLRRRVGRDLLVDRLLREFLNWRVVSQTVDGRTHERIPATVLADIRWPGRPRQAAPPPRVEANSTTST